MDNPESKKAWAKWLLKEKQEKSYIIEHLSEGFTNRLYVMAEPKTLSEIAKKLCSFRSETLSEMFIGNWFLGMEPSHSQGMCFSFIERKPEAILNLLANLDCDYYWLSYKDLLLGDEAKLMTRIRGKHKTFLINEIAFRLIWKMALGNNDNTSL